jgi:hypothetical protein
MVAGLRAPTHAGKERLQRHAQREGERHGRDLHQTAGEVLVEHLREQIEPDGDIQQAKARDAQAHDGPGAEGDLQAVVE